MDYSVLFNTGNKAGKLSTNKLIIDDYKDKGLSFLKKGQLITGIVVSVDEQVTLNFNGQKATASKSIFKNVMPGDIKTFEVMKALKNEIELKLLDGINGSRQSFKATMVKEADWETVRAQKNKEAAKVGKEAQYKQTKNQLEEIGTKLTERDCRRLEEEGFSIGFFSISGLYHALNRIKTGALEEKPMTAGKSSGKMNSFDEDAIAQRLREENLPVTAENTAKISKALDLSNTVTKIDDKTMQYLISRAAEPSVANIYKALYSGTAQNAEKLTKEAWSDLEGQVEEAIKTAGYEVNEENLRSARWLIENELPLTAETFSYKKELEELKFNSDKDTLLNRMLEGMKNGLSPMEAPLLEQNSVTAEQIVADIKSIRPETITEAINSGSELTIKNLISTQESLAAAGKKSNANSKDEIITASETGNTARDASITAGEGNAEKLTMDEVSGRNSGAENSRYSYEEVRARRQLEEIRLKMTLEAAAQLEKNGFSVETQQLSKVVDALKELEDSYYKGFFKEIGTEVTESSLQILKETTQSIEQLKYIPINVLGSTLADRNIQTIPSLLSEGNQLQAKLEKAGTAYENLMTVPNSEYGDSIKKAFANMDSLLAGMNLENTIENQRAVRILGYNRMEITQESINQVKAYDLQVITMIKNLHPGVTVRMIKEGINPLEMPINELNKTIDSIKEEQGISSEEKFSTYLRQLEKEKGITAEERKAYIGIYRLLYNVEKSDGAALGAVVKAGQEVTLEHLLTALQISKKGRLDAVIGDEFGTLQSLSRDNESMAQQLSSFSSDAGQQSKEQTAKDNAAAEQTEYLNRVLKQIKEELSPDTLKETGQNLTQTSVSQSTSPVQASTAQQGIWETIKNVPMDKLLNQLQNANGNFTEGDQVYAQKVQEIRDLCKNSEQSIRFLNDFQMPTTTANIIMANHILNNGESPIKKLLKLQNEKTIEKSENSLKEMNDLSDTLSDKHSMEEAYTQLETDAKAASYQSYSEERIDNWKLAELKSIGQQMTFIKALAEKEFYQIPIETNQGVTNINLTILRGTQTSGKVSVTIWSEQLGNVKADFSLKDRTLKGYISSDSRSGLELLQNNAGQIESAAAANNVTLKHLDFGIQKVTETYSYQNPSLGESTTAMKAETERTLYQLAKAIVRTVRSAENGGSDTDRAVS